MDDVSNLPIDLPELNPDARLGIELEGWFPRSHNVGYGFTSQRRHARYCLDNAGVPYARGNRRDSSYSRWQVIPELVMPRRIPEIISPIIQGSDGIRQIAAVFCSLNGNGFTANRFCGLHVHVSRKSSLWNLREVWQVQKVFESQWDDYDECLAADRRGVWPASGPEDALNYCAGYGTFEWKAREAATYADPATLHYIVGIANFTLAAAEDTDAQLLDYLSPCLPHKPSTLIQTGARSPVQPVVS